MTFSKMGFAGRSKSLLRPPVYPENRPFARFSLLAARQRRG
jgi:hypothetical protein